MLGLLLILVICGLWLFILTHILQFGYDLALDHDDKWYGGLPLWLTWAMGWTLAPIIILVGYIAGGVN